MKKVHYRVHKSQTLDHILYQMNIENFPTNYFLQGSLSCHLIVGIRIAYFKFCVKKYCTNSSHASPMIRYSETLTAEKIIVYKDNIIKRNKIKILTKMLARFSAFVDIKHKKQKLDKTTPPLPVKPIRSKPFRQAVF